MSDQTIIYIPFYQVPFVFIDSFLKVTISYLGFIMTMVIVIFFAHERKLHQLTTYLNF